VEANRKVYDLQIKSLDEQATKLQSQIESLTAQLQTANREVQELALQAIKGSTRQAKADNAS
jgi:chaperonin cofactor prefoldin